MLRRIRHMLSRRRNQEQKLESARLRMLQHDLLERDITSPRVMGAMGKVPRELFVGEASRDQAYGDSALPIGQGQTISQPYMVALMTQLLEVQPESHVLEIGTGSGYQAAVLAELAASVVTMERHGGLSHTAQRALADAGCDNIHFVIGDGSLGWSEEAPYDRILVTAAAEKVPPALVEQLADGGILVAPIGPRDRQRIEVYRKRGDKIERDTGTPCRFVPLVGQQGFAE